MFNVFKRKPTKSFQNSVRVLFMYQIWRDLQKTQRNKKTYSSDNNINLQEYRQFVRHRIC